MRRERSYEPTPNGDRVQTPTPSCDSGFEEPPPPQYASPPPAYAAQQPSVSQAPDAQNHQASAAQNDEASGAHAEEASVTEDDNSGILWSGSVSATSPSATNSRASSPEANGVFEFAEVTFVATYNRRLGWDERPGDRWSGSPLRQPHGAIVREARIRDNSTTASLRSRGQDHDAGSPAVPERAHFALENAPGDIERGFSSWPSQNTRRAAGELTFWLTVVGGALTMAGLVVIMIVVPFYVCR